MCGPTWARRSHHKDCRGVTVTRSIVHGWPPRQQDRNVRSGLHGCRRKPPTKPNGPASSTPKANGGREPWHLRVASRCRHPSCRARQQFLTHCATARWSWLAKMAAPATSVPITSASDTILVVIQPPGWPRCAILLLDPLRPARTLDMSGACSPSSTWKSRVPFAAEVGRPHGNAVPVRSDFPDATCRSADSRHEDGHATLVVCVIAESNGTSAGRSPTSSLRCRR